MADIDIFQHDDVHDPIDDFLWLMVRPRLWSRLGKTDFAWSRFISVAVDAGDICNVGQHTAEIGGVTVWIANAPYGDGHAYPGPYVMPSRRVADKMRRAVSEVAVRETMERVRRSRALAHPHRGDSA